RILIVRWSAAMVARSRCGWRRAANFPSSKAPAPPSSWQGDLVPIGFDSNHASAPPPSQRAGAKSGDDVVAFGREEVAVEWPRDVCAAGKASPRRTLHVLNHLGIILVRIRREPGKGYEVRRLALPSLAL